MVDDRALEPDLGDFFGKLINLFMRGMTEEQRRAGVGALAGSSPGTLLKSMPFISARDARRARS
jgi:hypothetical protein